jgi:hypothetical protein
MSYIVRFESNAFKADGTINKVLGALDRLKRQFGRQVQITENETAGPKIKTLFEVNQRIFNKAMEWASEDFDNQIEAIQWSWKGPEGVTRRRNGRQVTELRDIVDTGQLLRSKTEREIKKGVTEFEWTADHAQAVHDGQMTKDGSINPPRPWTEPTLQNAENAVARIFREETK